LRFELDNDVEYLDYKILGVQYVAGKFAFLAVADAEGRTIAISPDRIRIIENMSDYRKRETRRLVDRIKLRHGIDIPDEFREVLETRIHQYEGMRPILDDVDKVIGVEVDFDAGAPRRISWSKLDGNKNT